MTTLPRKGDESWLAGQAYLGYIDRFAIPKKPQNVPRFAMLVLGMLCSVAISTVFSFSLITKKLQDDYNFSQDDITTISTVGIVIGYFTFPFGMIYDYIGPKPIFAIGIVCNLLGTLLFAASFNGTIGHSVVGLSFINAVVNLGCSMYDIAVVLTILSWFPLDRGMVIACFKTTTGMGSSVVATIYSTFFNNNNVTYMYFLAAWSTFIGLVSLSFFHLPPYHMTGHRLTNYREEDRYRAGQYLSLYMKNRAPLKRFVITFSVVFSLVIILTIRSIFFVFVDNPTMSEKLPSTMVVIVIYLSLLFACAPIVWLDRQPAFYDREEGEKEVDTVGGSSSSASPSAMHREEEEGDGAAAVVDDRDVILEEKEAARAHSADDVVHSAAGNTTEESFTPADAKKNVWRRVVDAVSSKGSAAVDIPRVVPSTREGIVEALTHLSEEDKISPQMATGFLYNLLRPQLFGMCLTAFCVSAAGNVILLNSTQIYIAISEDPFDVHRPALCVALTGVGSALGRIIMSFIEVGTQHTPPERRITLSFTCMIPPALLFCSCVFFLYVPVKGLVVPMFLGGCGYGFSAACEILNIRAIFSTQISMHYNSLYFAEMLGVVFMNRLLFGMIMTNNSETGSDGRIRCLGRNRCIRTPFYVLAGMSILGVMGGLMTHLSYRSFAKKEYAKRREYRARLEDALARVASSATDVSKQN